ELFCFRAKDGELLWKYRYATEVRGAPLVADGKLYIFDVKAKMVVLTLKGNERPDENDTFEHRFPGPGGQLNETNGTPIAVNGRQVQDNRPSPATKWTLPEPPVPKGAKTGPPPLQGKIEDGALTLGPQPNQQGYVDFECGPKARARVRVVPQIPYTQNFDKIP